MDVAAQEAGSTVTSALTAAFTSIASSVPANFTDIPAAYPSWVSSGVSDAGVRQRWLPPKESFDRFRIIFYALTSFFRRIS